MFVNEVGSLSCWVFFFAAKWKELLGGYFWLKSKSQSLLTFLFSSSARQGRGVCDGLGFFRG